MRRVSAARVVRFGPFEADEEAFELRRDGEPLCLPRHVLELVFFLVKTRGALVTNADLIRGPWRGTSVGQAAIARAIMLARRALSCGRGRSDSKSFIVTVRGKGYRFVGSLTDPVSQSVRVSEPGAAGELGRGGPSHARHVLRVAIRRAMRGLGSVVLMVAPEATEEDSVAELLERFAAEASQQGAAVSRTRASARPASPLEPWLDILSRDIGSEVDMVSSRCSTDIAQDVYEPLARRLFRKAHDCPSVVLIQDFQWASEESMRMLGFICRRIAQVPLLVVATSCDPDALSQVPPLELLEVLPCRTERWSDHSLRVLVSFA